MSRADESGRDGLREALEWVAIEWEAHRPTCNLAARELRALLAEHPPTPAEEPAEVAVEEREALREAAAWVADSIGYPVQVEMPHHPMPQALWDALVDHIHADESGKWHGNTLDREGTEWWLADEAGRTPEASA